MGDYRTTRGQDPPLTSRGRRRKRLRILLLSLTVLVVIGALGAVIRVNRHVLAPGYVITEPYAEIRPAVVGKIAAILVGTGAEVEEGDLMIQLDDLEERASLEEALSQMHKVEAELVRRRAQIAERKRLSEKNISLARLRLEHASARLRLTKELSEKGLASGRAVEDQQLNEKVTQAELDALLAEDETLSEKELAVLQRELEARQDAVTRAEARVDARQVRAPISGRVLRYEFVVGELVRPDTVLYEVFGGDKLVLKLRVPERYATLVAPGQPYTAELLPYAPRHLEFPGRVDRLRGVIQAENQKTYRITTCSFDPMGHDVPPGTTAEARIRVGRSSLWAGLFGMF